MCLTLQLHPTHVQRIRTAVEAAMQGKQITIRMDGDGDTAYITWVHRNRHVIASGGEGGMKRLLPLVEEEFARQLQSAKSKGDL